MTVIAYKDGVMAADSQWTETKTDIVRPLPKLQRLTGGALYGGAGDGDDRSLLELLQDVTRPDQFPTREKLREFDYDCCALVVLPLHGQWCVETGKEGGGVEPMPAVCAIGSGAPVALGAMAAGADALRAVSITCALHAGCSEPVHSLKLAEE